MAAGVSLVWSLTWTLWALVVYKDFRREPKDARRLVSLVALVILAVMTRDSLRDVNLRFTLLATLAVVVLAVWTVADLLASRRTAKLSAWAAQHGYECVALNPKQTTESLPSGLAKLPMLTKGSTPFTVGVLQRKTASNREILVFRHTVRRRVVWYDVSGIEATGTVVAVRQPGIWLPRFQIRPVGLLPWMDGGIVGDVVPSPTGTSFSKSYRLGSDEPRNLRTVFGDDLLARIAEKPGWLIEGEGEWIAAFTFDRTDNLMALKTSKLRTVGLGDLESFTAEAGAILDRIADRASRSKPQGADAA